MASEKMSALESYACVRAPSTAATSGAMKRTVPQFDVRSSPDTLSSASAWAWSSMLPNELTPCIEESSIVASDSHDRVRSTPLPFRVRAMPKSPSFTRSDAVRRKFAGFMSLRGTDAVANCRETRRLSCGRVDDVEHRCEL